MKNSRASNMIEIGTGLWWYWGPPNNKTSQGRKASWRKWAIGRQMGGEVGREVQNARQQRGQQRGQKSLAGSKNPMQVSASAGNQDHEVLNSSAMVKEQISSFGLSL